MTDVCFAFGPGDSFFFESQSCWRLKALPPKLQLKFMAGTSDIAHVYQLVLGVNDSWFISYKTKAGGSSFTHDGLPEKLAAWLRIRDEHGYTVRNVPKLKVCLGPGNQSFWAEDGRDYYWDNLPNPLEAALQKLISPTSGWIKTPKIVALGVYQSYVLVTDGGGGSFAVSDYYPYLQKELDAFVRSKQPGALKQIHYVNMDSHDRDNFVLTTVTGDVYYYIPDSLDNDMDIVRGTIPKTPFGVLGDQTNGEVMSAPMPISQSTYVPAGGVGAPETMNAPLAGQTGFVQVATPPGSGVGMYQQMPMQGMMSPQMQNAHLYSPNVLQGMQQSYQGQSAPNSQRPASPEAAYQHPHVTALENAAREEGVASPATTEQTLDTSNTALSESQGPSALTPISSVPPQIHSPQASHVQIDPTTGQPIQRFVSPLHTFSPSQSHTSQGNVQQKPADPNTAASPPPQASASPLQGSTASSSVQQYVQEQQKLYAASVNPMQGSQVQQQTTPQQQQAQTQSQEHTQKQPQPQSTPQSPLQKPPQSPSQVQSPAQAPAPSQSPANSQTQSQIINSGLMRHGSLMAPIPVSTLAADTTPQGIPPHANAGQRNTPTHSPLPPGSPPAELSSNPMPTAPAKSQHLEPPAPPSPSDLAPEVVMPGSEYYSPGAAPGYPPSLKPYPPPQAPYPPVSDEGLVQSPQLIQAPQPPPSSVNTAQSRPQLMSSSMPSFNEYQQVPQPRPMNMRVGSESSEKSRYDPFMNREHTSAVEDYAGYQAQQQYRPYSQQPFQPTYPPYPPQQQQVYQYVQNPQTQYVPQPPPSNTSTPTNVSLPQQAVSPATSGVLPYPDNSVQSPVTHPRTYSQSSGVASLAQHSGTMSPPPPAYPNQQQLYLQLQAQYPQLQPYQLQQLCMEQLQLQQLQLQQPQVYAHLPQQQQQQQQQQYVQNGQYQMQQQQGQDATRSIPQQQQQYLGQGLPSPAPSAPAGYAPTPVASPDAGAARHNSYTGRASISSTTSSMKSMLNGIGKNIKGNLSSSSRPNKLAQEPAHAPAVSSPPPQQHQPQQSGGDGAAGLVSGVSAMKIEEGQTDGGGGGSVRTSVTEGQGMGQEAAGSEAGRDAQASGGPASHSVPTDFSALLDANYARNQMALKGTTHSHQES